jgi:hypothetical protein
MRQIFFLAISLFIACQCSSQVVTNTNHKAELDSIQSAQEVKINVALAFINAYVDNCNKIKKAVGAVEWVNTNKLVTKAFKTELKKIMDEANKADPVMGLDFDPLFNAQDYPDKGFELDSIDNNGNSLILNGKDWMTFKLKIKVVNEKGRWLVDGCGIINMPNDRKVQ